MPTFVMAVGTIIICGFLYISPVDFIGFAFDIVQKIIRVLGEVVESVFNVLLFLGQELSTAYYSRFDFIVAMGVEMYKIIICGISNLKLYILIYPY